MCVGNSRADQTDKARGALLGLILGDAVGVAGGKVPDDGPLRCSSGAQLSCFTVDAMIRSHVRASIKGIGGSETSMAWYGYARWAALQGVTDVADRPEGPRPDGWLAQIPVMAERRGSAPATVNALRGRVMGTQEEPVGSSFGAHALTRALPIGLYPAGPRTGQLAAAVAATTHCGEAVHAAALGATLIRLLASGLGIGDACVAADEEYPESAGSPEGSPIAAAAEALHAAPGDPSMVAGLAPNGRATSALASGVYTALSLPGRDQVRDAVVFAASAGNRHGAAVAGAVLGALHGADALPGDWLSRCELVWVGDTLARDLVREITEVPAGSGYDDDTFWHHRYPG
ncbi:ADP-ribosylglycohydrolase family protein [Catellatospora chokoriensis]|uniref:ADP-ribosylglycohydrolase n=1 Tax=Catellatospora chokoriensis TaxID=310353 RepID=A0A8J3K8P0_9ACTN|nr:ADP-ribosylglycohydrolase family protein [Catellatospora chokoriensis]GIF91504.1 ADP-ribosylglycohydrolase [Catellatospora chokoriensis]